MLLRIVLVLFVCLSCCCAASEISIHRMVVGEKVLELGDTTRLTSVSEGRVSSASISPDGKQVAYIAPRGLCLVKASGGRPTVVLPASPEFLEVPEGDVPAEGTVWQPRGPIVWSPDGKYVAVGAQHLSWRNEAGSQMPATTGWTGCVLLLAPNGAHVATLAGPTQSWVAETEGSVCFSPDSRRLFALFASPAAGTNEYNLDVVMSLRVSGGASEVLYSRNMGCLTLKGCMPDSSALLCEWAQDSSRSLVSIPADGGEASIVGDANGPDHPFSPDRQLRVRADKPGIFVENVSSGAAAQLVKSEEADFVSWAPNSRMLLYQFPQVIHDAAEERSRSLNTLWLASVQFTRLNTMCVALDADNDLVPSLSADCTRIVYTSGGCLYTAEIVRRDVTPQEKLAAGLPLTEEEEKAVLAGRAREIAIATLMYSSDWDGNLPDPATATEDLYPYLRDAAAFLRPGTDQPIFTYILPPGATKETDIDHPADTVIGELDPGVYGWKIAIYADGHVRVVQK